MIRRRMRPHHANLAAVGVVGLGALALGASCTTKGEGLILVVLSSTQALDHVSVFVTAPNTQADLGKVEDYPWPTTQPLQLGIHVPSTVSGTVDVIACGFDASDNLIASTPNNPATFSTGARPGAASDQVNMALVPESSPPALCAAVGTSGRGGSGGGGGSAGGSTGGSTSTGGTGGGAGGGAGTGGGSAGTTGAGGTSGTGGSVAGAGGGAGIGGRGGTTGTGGVAGAAGRGGTSGTGGVAGTGGRGGAAGTGGGGGGTSGTGWRGAVVMPAVVGQSQRNPSVAVDPAGNAVVIYDQGGQVWANHYDRTSGWGTPGAVDSRGMLQGGPQIAVDKNGTYLAVWGLQTGSSLQGIWYKTSTNGVDWPGQPQSLTTTIAVFPVVAMNADGAALVAWSEQIQGALYQPVGAARPAPGTPWQLKILRTGDYGDRDPVVAMAGNGYGFVGWTQHDGLGNFFDSVWMAQFTVPGGVGWTASATIEDYVGYNAYGPSIATNTGGDAIVTYTQISTTNPRTVQVWARRFNGLTKAWETNLRIFEAPSIDSYLPHSVTLDDAGNATVAFPVETSTGFQVQTSRTARTATMWPSAPTAMETDDIANTNDPNSNIAHVTMPIVRSDPAGNVTLVWRKRTAASGLRFDLVSRRYSAGNWAPAVTAPATPLEDNLTNSVFFPTLAVGTGGTVVTAWYFANSLDVWANVFP
jgi:hypothetical protein